jgi:hypothetical protein
MFRMLTCFDLKPEFTLDDFQQSLDNYTEHMRSLDLVEDRSPIGLRQSDTILDTDNERKHKYFMFMHFRDRVQSDKAVDYMRSHKHKKPGDSSHKEVYSMAQNLIFICWQDI